MPGEFVIGLAVVGIIVLLAIAAFDLLTLSFSRLGLSPWAVLLIFTASALGSLINIPLYHSVGPSTVPGVLHRIHGILYFVPPRTTEQIVAINVGGAVIPILLSLWLLPRAPLLRTLLATAIVAVVAHHIATIEPQRGIVMPVMIGPLLAAFLAIVLTGARGAAPVAYIAGTMGILIGADLANLSRMSELGSGVLSIGGAGVFDGVFITGIVAALFSFDRPKRPRYTRPITT